MRTLEQFQSEVLAQLRKERDDKFAATYDEEAKVEAEAENARNQLDNEKREFLHKQAEERHIFDEEQAAKRQQIHIAYYSGRAAVKRHRRAINEEYTIDVNNVPDDIPVEELQEYLQQRIGKAEEQPTKDSILSLCRHRIPRNMAWDKEEVKRAICEVVEEVW